MAYLVLYKFTPVYEWAHCEDVGSYRSRYVNGSLISWIIKKKLNYENLQILKMVNVYLFARIKVLWFSPTEIPVDFVAIP